MQFIFSLDCEKVSDVKWSSVFGSVRMFLQSCGEEEEASQRCFPNDFSTEIQEMVFF